MTGSLRSLVAVSADAQREDLIDALTIDANDYDIVFVESLASASARIRLAAPELVIVVLDIDDACACQQQALVQLECERLMIPVVTCAGRTPRGEIDELIPVDLQAAYRRAALPMN
ncbi:MAG TPA: hypothetical protein VKE96_03950 [Vicinamibacterales bacterium]|nr:hypothetical protein [Vicinamibacterales bacterium]